MTNQKRTKLNSNVPKTNVRLMSFKTCYCIKASNNVIMMFKELVNMMNKYETWLYYYSHI